MVVFHNNENIDIGCTNISINLNLYLLNMFNNECNSPIYVKLMEINLSE